jgi:Histidine phosphatase superfamily (branch 1)
MTAGAIKDAQENTWPGNVCSVVKLAILREQDFGSLECTPWASRRGVVLHDQTTTSPDHANFVPKETNKAMTQRAEVFLDDYLTPLLALDTEEENYIAVVSHGMFLGVLWRSLLARFGPQSISLAPEVRGNMAGRPLQYRPGWANTGFLELDIVNGTNGSAMQETNVITGLPFAFSESTNPQSALAHWKMVVRAVNGTEHLNNLKRTRGGVGSATFDAKQKNLETFFRKP